MLLTSGANPWAVFNEILGSNRKSRADTLGDILNHLQTETPKVLSDLQTSGIIFKPNGGKSHFIKDAEFKTTLARCLTLLNNVEVPKKSLLMFRAITDTASDGQFSILLDVGINIDLTNPNLLKIINYSSLGR